ncbi:HAD-IA family hydrolase [Streptococcus ovuberis]|uniref:HAD-IA family hydrolase n=1 Tax=Streptococcus ovuberis TaxID=1936207 RepID=A0A7X6MYA7_9STRE|nr:HAD-IA family hydrolase [Streptococcus ovuberis]NKZ20595.1 HAD-IA family hydrolase [Streptococcus ovuberis]
MKHLFFDLDGTLANSSPGIINSFTKTFTDLGIPLPNGETLKSFIGPPLETSFAHFGDLTFVNQAGDIYRHHYQSDGVYQVTLYDDIAETLKVLKNTGHKLYVATSKNQPMAIKMLQNLNIDHYFVEIFGSLGKDHKADVIKRGLDKYELTPPETYMIGDTHYDMVGGKSLNLNTIGVTWGFGSEQSLLENGADFLIHQPLELLDLLKAT